MARLLFFGKLGDLAGGRTREMKLDATTRTVAQLIDLIGKNDSELGRALGEPSIRFIVNEKIVSASQNIMHEDEIAFLPPVSGG